MGKLSSIRTTEWLLINWGRWAHVNKGASLTYPSIEPYERMRAPDRRPNPLIGDEDAIIVDKAVAELCAIRPTEGDALAKYYLSDVTYRELGRRMGRHHKIISDWVCSGKMWVEGRIIDSL